MILRQSVRNFVCRPPGMAPQLEFGMDYCMTARKSAVFLAGDRRQGGEGGEELPMISFLVFYNLKAQFDHQL